jgi:hypothetical protein
MEYNGVALSYDYDLKKWISINRFGNGAFIKGDVRGVSLLEMANYFKSGELRNDNIVNALHVVKVMCAIEKSGSSGNKVLI